MTPMMTCGLLSVALLVGAPAEDPPAEEAPAEEAPAEEAPAEEAPTEEAPAADAGYDATLTLINGSVLRGRVIDENLTVIVIELEGVAAAPIEVARSTVQSVALGAAAVPPLPPQVVVIEPPVEAPPEIVTPAETGRGIGFGLNFGLGLGFGDTTNAIPQDPYGEINTSTERHFDLELPGLELRIFPEDRFSLDLLFKFGNAAALRNESGGYGGWYYMVNQMDVVLMAVYFHLHGPSGAWSKDANGNFAIAPGIVFGGAQAYGSPWWGQVGTSVRVGADITSANGAFGLGIYARPGFHVLNFVGYSEPGKAAEVMLEITWTWYTPREPDA